MKKFYLLLAAILMLGNVAVAQDPDNFPPDDTTITITSTNLPIVWIEVGGATIQRDERISAHMKIIHNGKGQLNYGDTVAHPGQHIDYEGYIALRYRGNSTYNMSDKKPYSFRTLEQPLEVSDKKKKVEILGMGKDNNWALMAPYADRSMIRDLLTFELARPWMEYAPDGRLCELYLDGIYYGVYVLSEVVSTGKHRLNLPDPGETGDELTGGYLVEVDTDDDSTHVSKYHPVSRTGKVYDDRQILFQYKAPEYEDMTPAQLEYINNAIDEMEDAFAQDDYTNPETGYRKYIDTQNFIDYQLFTELSHNVDGYRLSGKMFKRRDSVDSRFKMVLWDMNLGYGNARHHNSWNTYTWVYQSNDIMYRVGETYLIPFWWYKLNNDLNGYWKERNARWREMRAANLSKRNIWATIDSLVNEVTVCGAEARNSQAWPRWGEFVWPNHYIASSYEDEIAYLKQWISDRLAWLDMKMHYDAPPEYEPGDVNGDGEVSIGDVNVVIDILLGLEVDQDVRDRADVDGDGELSIADLQRIIDKLLAG